MAHPRFPLRINVGFLINRPIGSSRDIHFEFSELDLEQDFHITEFQGVIKVTRTQQGILVQGDFKGNVDQECVRCLTDYQQEIHTIFSELYAFKYKGMTESGLTIPEDGNIDLGPLVREYLLLEIPMRPLCKEDCKGLCAVCGADLNSETCSHQVNNKTYQPKGLQYAVLVKEFDSKTGFTPASIYGANRFWNSGGIFQWQIRAEKNVIPKF